MTSSVSYMLSPILLAILFLSPVSESATKFTIKNICPDTIWPGMSSSQGSSLEVGGFELKPKHSKDFTAPAGWTGRIWARTGCEFDQKGQGKCQTGPCGDSLNCSGSSGTPPVTLVEFSLTQFQQLDFYDVSLVDGFNVPVAVTPIDGQGNCSVARCDGDHLWTKCPPELAFKANGKTVACTSPCYAFNMARYCCTGAYNTRETCMPTDYSKIFKEACPAAYSYTYDDDRLSTFTCSGADYVITFCSSRSDLYPSSTNVLAPATAPTVAIPPPKKKRKSPPTVIVVAVIISIIFCTGLVAISYFLFLKRKQKALAEDGAEGNIMTVETLRFDFGTIRAATNDFSDDNKLGQGGFGVVYKGRDSNGRAIAVKRLSKDSGQGEVEFKNEVLLLARLEHKNLVRLLGFCFQGKERILIYELVKNSSLDNYIFNPTRGRNLDWETRYKIITGIARGLLYLHEDSRLRIIHRDLKASNVLLDEQMNPKIADFGLARLFGEDQTQQNTGRIVGTFGYMPPEYLRRGQFSVKSDVYSFGVLVLEIISGQRNSAFGTEEGDSLLTYTWKNWNEGRAADLIDERLRDGSSSEMMRCIHIGLLCVQEKATERPTMASVSLMLSSNSITRKVPSKPAFFIQPDDHEHENGSSQPPSSINKLSITQLNPR